MTSRISTWMVCCIVLTGLSCGAPPDRAGNQHAAPLMDPHDAAWTRPAPDSFDVSIGTTKGDFVARIYRGWAPIGVDRFFHLVESGFYDDSRFFRVRAGFIVQFGIPGNPSVAATWVEQTIPDDSVRMSNTRGTLAFAMTGPNTRTTQIYINYADNSRLDEQGFAPIGRVIQGMNLVDALYAEYDESAGGGMRGGQQGPLLEGGNAYLDREFPHLDKLLFAKVVRRWPQTDPRGVS